MTLFKISIAEQLSAELHGLVDDYAENLSNYISISEKVEDREEIAEGLLSGAAMSVIAALPVGMWIGSSYLDSMVGGATIGAILPTGLGLGAGLISYLNHRDSHKLYLDSDLDKPMQSQHNAVAGKDFLDKLSELNIGEAFNDVKAVVDESIKNPPKYQEDVGAQVRTALSKHKL